VVDRRINVRSTPDVRRDVLTATETKEILHPQTKQGVEESGRPATESPAVLSSSPVSYLVVLRVLASNQL
jgi:hypothetical protein